MCLVSGRTSGCETLPRKQRRVYRYPPRFKELNKEYRGVGGEHDHAASGNTHQDSHLGCRYDDRKKEEGWLRNQRRDVSILHVSGGRNGVGGVGLLYNWERDRAYKISAKTDRNSRN